MMDTTLMVFTLIIPHDFADVIVCPEAGRSGFSCASVVDYLLLKKRHIPNCEVVVQVRLLTV